MTKSTDAGVVERLVNTGEPWVVYGALRDLAGAEQSRVDAARERLVAHPLVADLIASLDIWPPAPLGRAYDPKDVIWKLGILADFGLTRDDPPIATIAERLFAAQAPDGAFLTGGFDHTRSWHTRPYICIAHAVTEALARFGYLNDPRLDRAYAQIAAWQRDDGGWHPNAKNLPGGEGAVESSCPFGTMNVLRALVAHPARADGVVARRGGEYLLSCWSRRAEPYRPVGFGIGSTFLKLQYPFVQYQLLKVFDTLTQIPSLRADARLREMAAVVRERENADGLWTAESVNKPYAAFDFGQKKQPSPWLTLVALRALSRIDG